MTTDPGEGMAELSQQIAKLMATLTQTRQSSGPSSAPGSPWEHGHRWGMVVGAAPVAWTPIMTGVALGRQPQPAA